MGTTERKRGLLPHQAGGPRFPTRPLHARQVGSRLKTGDRCGPRWQTAAAIRVGRVAVRASGFFRVGNADGINARYGKLLDRADGYWYTWRSALPPRAEAGGLEGTRMIPGGIITKPSDSELNAGPKTVTLTVAKSGDRPIQVASPGRQLLSFF